MRRPWHYFTIILGIAVASCGGSKATDAGIDPGLNLVTNGTFSATINGTSWSALGKVIVTRPTTSSLVLFSSSTTYALSLTMLNVTRPTTVSLNSSPFNGSNGAISSTAGGWNTGNTGGTGSVVVTTLTSNHVVGTFSFDGQPTAGTGATTTIHVTNGKFDLTF